MTGQPDTFAETYARTSGLVLAVLSAVALVGVSAGIALVAALMFVTLAWHTANHAPCTRTVLGEIILLVLLTLLALAVSLAQFADLPAPLWVDSYRHAADIQNILAHQRAALERVYHFGFHHIVAWIVQLVGVPIPAAMIAVGQWIVVQIGLSFFVFGKRLTHSTIVGFAGAICVWFLAPTPMYFLTWGRYPLLLGIAILPIALVAAMEWLDAPRGDGRAFLFVLVTLAGLAHAHLRLLAFYVAFIAIYGFWQRASARRLSILALALVSLGIVWSATILTQPTRAQYLAAVLTFWSGIDLTTAYNILRSHYGVAVWLVAACGLGVTLAQRRIPTLVSVIWFAALVLCAALFTALNLPLVEAPIVLLMAFFPAAFLIGELARALHARLRRTRWLVSLEIATGCLIVLLGAREMLTIFNPITILFTRADERAMQWIVANTPADARFFVNTFEWYPNVFVPTDGGAWIPYFAQRVIVTTPTEAFTHVYLGHREGIWRARDFANPARYVLVYAEEGVTIWQVK